MTRADLKAMTRRDLATMAKRHRVAGWHGMRKNELIDVLVRVTKSNGSVNGNGKAATNGSLRTTQSTRHENGDDSKAVRRGPLRLTAVQFAANGNGSGKRRDQLVAEVRDAYWIQVRWRLSQRILDRAEAALGLEWRTAVPAIRVFDVTDNDTGTESTIRVSDVEISTPTDTWFVPVAEAARSYVLEIGYRVPSGRFFVLAKSRTITTPNPSCSDDNSDEAVCSFESTSVRRVTTPASEAMAEAIRSQRTREDRFRTAKLNGNGDRFRRTNSRRTDNTEFQLDAELVIHGSAPPQSELTLMGEPVEVTPDGAFSVRFALTEGRQVIPTVMLTPCGNEQRTIILAIERNTKHLEPISLDELM